MIMVTTEYHIYLDDPQTTLVAAWHLSMGPSISTILNILFFSNFQFEG